MPNQPSFDMFAEPEPSPPTMSRTAGGAGLALSFDRLIPDGQLRVTKEIIGRGANGIVYVGFLKQPSGEEEPVAVKTLAPGATDEEHGDFFKEFSIMWEASKACPGVAQVHGCSKRGNAS